MAGFTAALKKLLQPFNSTQARRRQSRQLCDAVESLESRVLLSCTTATADTQPADVDTCTQDGADEDSHVDASGNEVHTAPTVDETGGATGDYDGTGTVADLSQTFYLHSNPEASHTIYLDFDGHVTSGTSWNSIYNGGNDIVTPAFSFEGDSSSFTDNELARIQRIWQRVAEDFLPFDVDVTTEDPGVDALTKSGSGDSSWGIRVVIGGGGSWYGSAGGVAYRGSFNWNSDTPAFVFEDNLGNGNEKYTTEAISHEVGHTLGLAHDGTSSSGTYQGHGSGETGWAALMGVGYYKNLTQWSQGEYPGANNTEDDLAIITSQNGFGYRADDYGNTFGTAESFLVTSDNVGATGVIEQNTDFDVFSFTTGAGNISFTASPAANGANLDILLELYDANGQLVASANPSEQLGATLSVTVAAGTYYLRVSGTGKGDPLNGGYSDYGSLGFYSVTGTIVSDTLPDTSGPRVISASSSGAVAGTLDTFTLTFSEAIADGTFTLADVTLAGPGGAITPTAVNKLSSTQYEVTFAPQTTVGIYTLTAGPQITDLAGNQMDQDQDAISGEATDDQFSTTAAVADTTGPRVISSSSSGATTGTLDTFTVTFSEAIADGTFALSDVTLTGPGGSITPTAVNKLSSTQYEVTFAPQSADGTYTLTIGPDITDAAGNAMDQDQDGAIGEAVDDQFTTTAVLPEYIGPSVIGAAASGSAADTLDKFTLTFSEAIADGTFTTADVSLTGPGGAITPSAVTRISSTQYEVTFASQSAVGTYTLTVGPDITDLMGNLMDQDQDGTTGEATDDQFSTTASISDTTGPRVISSSSSGATAGTLDTFTLNFSEPIADGTFTLADVTLTGPNGAITPTAVNKLSSTQYAVTFAPQTTVGMYTLTVGPQITDLAGNVMDQDQDGTAGESTDDRYIAAGEVLDTTGPRVISSSSSGAAAGTLDTFSVTFDEAIAEGTFTLADVTLSGPNGAITPTALNKLSSTQYSVTLRRTATGTYTLTVGPQIADLAGNAMDQDQDGATGEATDDRFTTSASITDTTGPRVIGSSSSGAITGTLDTFTLTFSEPIADGTFTLADVTLTGPNGAITPTAVNKLSSTQYEVTFAPQTTEGLYTLTIGPNIGDVAGNLMDQDQDGTGGEATQDQFATSTVLEAAPTEWRYDFGTVDSPVDTGYEQVNQSTQYQSSLGYGWTSGNVRDKDQQSGSDLTRDFNYSKDATFAMDLANGTYDVTITVGDAQREHEQMGIFLEGGQVDSIHSDAGQFVTRTYRVDVTDGQLTLRLRDLGGRDRNVVINAMTVVAVDGDVADTTGPRVIGSTSSGATAGTLDRFVLTFSEAIADGTFSVADVSLSGPDGAIAVTAVTKLSATQYEVTFAPQAAAGTYTLAVGPQVSDLKGNAMDQDQDGTSGETVDDVYTTSAALQSTGTDWHFDFGAGNSPVQSGYEQVDHNTSYDNGLGFGWLSGDVRGKDQRIGDDLTRDYNYATDATFAVDVPDGTYDVTITLGDAKLDHDLMAVYLEDQQVDVVSTSAGEFLTLTYRVEVTDGQLTLRIQDLGGIDRYVAINSLSIVAV